MATYKQLQDQIRQLQHEAEELRKNEISNAIAQIKMTMAEYGITLADLGYAGKKKSGTVRAPLAPKYRNPETGETWSGRGKAPRWIDPSNKENSLSSNPWPSFLPPFSEHGRKTRQTVVLRQIIYDDRPVKRVCMFYFQRTSG